MDDSREEAEVDELVGEFLVESFENLDQLDRDLVSLEQHPDDREVLKNIFRTVHTIKGMCGFFGFQRLESVSHVGENLLSLLRDGAATPSPDTITVLLALGDALREMLLAIEQTGNDGTREYGELIAELERHEREAAAKPAPPMKPGTRLGDILIERGIATEVDVTLALLQQQNGDKRPLGEILAESGAVDRDELNAVLEAQREMRSSPADTTLRVDVGLLDNLMRLVGELVLARNQLVQLGAQHADPALTSTTQRLNLVTTELQAGVMKTRMQPIGNVFGMFPRVVRDLAAQCGKRVRIEMEGRDTDLDKTIVEAIKDPLTHIVRNSVDHGIETPDARVAAGKPEEGVLRLRASHEGGQVVIEISDDGAGIDVARVKAKALERALVPPDQIARMNDRDALKLIFVPGFSTADTVTNVSGRGVGMDVVRTNIERIGGSIDVQSRTGEGTTLKVRIPLTLAILPALLVASANERYAIPLSNVVELVGVDAARAEHAIESVHGAPVYRLRGRILPLVYLDREFGRRPDPGDHEIDAARPITIVVLRANGSDFGLVVDLVHDTEELVVKPLSPQLEDLPVYSGCAIRGDGSVALILDVLGIAQRANVLSGAHERRVTADDAHDDGRDESPAETLLVLHVGDGARAAIPLAAVARLEEFDSSVVERSAGRDVVQYRGAILPLVDMGDALGFGTSVDAATDATRLHVVVHERGDADVGLVVNKIVDIVEQAVELHETAPRPGIVGTAVVQGAVTDVVDVDALLAAHAARQGAGA